MKKLLILLAALCSAVFPVSGQRARMYTPAEGLPNSRINCIMQDRTGFIWIASGNGLTRFDGRDFRHFQSDRDTGWGLAGNLVLRTFQDSYGRIWVATATGLQTYSPDDGTFSTVILDEDAPFASTSYHITDISEVNDGEGHSEIWIGTYNNGIFIVDGVTCSLLGERSATVNSLLGKPSVSRLFADSHGQMWIASGEGGLSVFSVSSLDAQSGIRMPAQDREAISRILVSEFAEDKASGNVILCSSNFGILIYDSATRTISRSADDAARHCSAMSITADNLLSPGGGSYLIGTENQGIKSYNILTDRMADPPEGKIPFDSSRWKVHSLMTDSQGNIWVGIYERGILVLPNPMFGFEYTGVSSEFREGHFPEGCVTSILRDPEDKSLWIGTDGYGLLNIRPDGTRRFYDTDNSRLTDNTVMALAADRHGTIWISTFRGGLYVKQRGSEPRIFKDMDRIGTAMTVDLAYDPFSDVVYLGTHSNGMAIIDPVGERLVSNVCDDACKWISCLYVDKQGLLWVGTYNGPMIYNDKLGRIIRYNMADKSLNSRILCFMEAYDGTMWMGTGDGLFSFDRTSGEERRYSGQEGLSNNVIYEILQSPEGDIWISSAFGLSRLNPGTGRFTRYYASDGLQENEFHQRAAMIDSDGRLHFGGINGISSFYSNSVESRPHPVPTVLFTDLRVGSGEATDISSMKAEAVTVPYGSNNISVKFTALEFTNPDKIRYDYRLDKLDREWKSSVDASAGATYTNLAPGRYTLMVRAYFDGHEDEFSQAALDIRISPPWYLSTGAAVSYCIILALTAFLALIVLNRHKRHRLQIMRAREDQNRLRVMSGLSTQICTPLNLVVSPLKELRDTEENQTRRHTLDMMYRNCRRVQELVEQMADPKRLEGIQNPPSFVTTPDIPDSQHESAENGQALEQGIPHKVKSRKSIIIVDDDQETRNFLKTELGRKYNVQASRGGRGAWELISSEMPDAVITEVLTCEIDGYELCTKIRHNPQTNHIPVIILTTLHDEESAKKGSECGADLFLCKPLSMDFLKSCVANIIATRETMRRKFSSVTGINYGKPGEGLARDESEKFEQRVMDIIEENIKDPDFGVEALSRQIGISRVHLNRRLKECMDISPGSLIRSVRLKHAAFLLLRNDLNISEAASLTGFTTASYFSSSFHDYFGISPKEFIKKYQGSEDLSSLKNIFGDSFPNDDTANEK